MNTIIQLVVCNVLVSEIVVDSVVVVVVVVVDVVVDDDDVSIASSVLD